MLLTTVFTNEEEEMWDILRDYLPGTSSMTRQSDGSSTRFEGYVRHEWNKGVSRNRASASATHVEALLRLLMEYRCFGATHETLLHVGYEDGDRLVVFPGAFRATDNKEQVKLLIVILANAFYSLSPMVKGDSARFIASCMLAEQVEGLMRSCCNAVPGVSSTMPQLCAVAAEELSQEPFATRSPIGNTSKKREREKKLERKTTGLVIKLSPKQKQMAKDAKNDTSRFDEWLPEFMSVSFIERPLEEDSSKRLCTY